MIRISNSDSIDHLNSSKPNSPSDQFIPVPVEKSDQKEEEKLQELNMEENSYSDNKIYPEAVVSTISNNLLTDFTIYWENFSVPVEVNPYVRYIGRKPEFKYILRNIDGNFRSGQLIAIMGPSGCGKSTLINCIANRWHGSTEGDIYLSGDRARLNMAFIPQYDNYFDVLTVKETLVYASRLQTSTLVASNYYKAYKALSQEGPSARLDVRRFTVSDTNYHHLASNHILSLFGLDHVMSTRVGKLSGGQKKRLSIAQELISRPDILILDEPTSGLDSAASYNCIEILRSLASAKPSMLIMVTIHQPNMKIFELFDKIYVLSSQGQLVYDGPPEALVPHLDKVGTPCPAFTSPGDFLIEIASGEHGLEPLNILLANPTAFENKFERETLDQKILNHSAFRASYPHFKHFIILFQRAFILILRDPLLTASRFGIHISMALFLGWFYGPYIGRYGGCPPDLGSTFDIHAIRTASNEVLDEAKGLLDNFSALFFSLLLLMFGSLTPMLITFPLELSIFIKEKSNGWYGVGSYFLARTLADLPFQVITSVLYVSITYYMNGQIKEWDRFSAYLTICVMVALIGQSHGLAIGSFFVHNVTAAVFLGPASCLPLLLFSGFLVKIETMPALLRPLTNLSYIRFGFEGVLISLYGFFRCGKGTMEKIDMMKSMFQGWLNKMFAIAFETITGDEDSPEQIKQVRDITDSLTTAVFNSVGGGLAKGAGGNRTEVESGVMIIYNLKDDYLRRTFWVLAVNLFVYRFITFLIIRYRASH
ncbi:ATP-binding cassette sub-family G member 1-like [Panonychus citri]|uniref:ATP-binding cassette sub-family G member 1-like n=1 Tax=Panonychus citri TaxID=50023 RepID=UPI002307C506|nr:ATP-binding cassette sub-family G member 1-like [Panonychus citri]